MSLPARTSRRSYCILDGSIHRHSGLLLVCGSRMGSCRRSHRDTGSCNRARPGNLLASALKYHRRDRRSSSLLGLHFHRTEPWSCALDQPRPSRARRASCCPCCVLSAVLSLRWCCRNVWCSWLLGGGCSRRRAMTARCTDVGPHYTVHALDLVL